MGAYRAQYQNKRGKWIGLDKTTSPTIEDVEKRIDRTVALAALDAEHWRILDGAGGVVREIDFPKK